MRYLVAMLALALIGPAPALADKPDKVPPGHAKKGGLPPGLAKKSGAPPPARVYVALDPVRDDRAWFLVDGRWVLRQGFDSAVRIEVRDARLLPAVPPPVVLPSLNVALRVVVFE